MRSTEFTAIGADACPIGWFVTEIQDGNARTEGYPCFEKLYDAHSDADQILVDIPIGSSVDQRRRCDTRAKDLLGCRGLSVFYPPVETAVECESYVEASRAHKESTGNGLSQQAFNITDKIREVATVIDDQDTEIIKESHPELCFAAFNGQPIAYSKSTDYGQGLRLDLLAQNLDDAKELYRNARDEFLLKEVGRDDILDSIVLAIAAKDNSLSTVPDDPQDDEPRIYYPEFELPSAPEY